jgi:hypothetical protein
MMLAALAWCGVTTAHAQTTNPDRVVYFTFTQPVTIPGSTLPAGRYRFQVLQSLTDRGILRIQSDDSSKTFGTLLVVPTTRTDVVAAPELRFLETAASAPPAIGSYWMPATGIGWEFVYPKDQATQLSINTKSPVLTGPAPGTLAQQTSINGLTRTGANGQSTAYAPSTTPTPVSGGVLRGTMDPDDTPVAQAASNAAQSVDNAAASAASAPRAPAPAPPSNPRAIDSNSPAPAPARSTTMAQSTASAQSGINDTETRSTRTTLPATAGKSPLAALAGLMALAAAVGLFGWRRVA